MNPVTSSLCSSVHGGKLGMVVYSSIISVSASLGSCHVSQHRTGAAAQLHELSQKLRPVVLVIAGSRFHQSYHLTVSLREGGGGDWFWGS